MAACLVAVSVGVALLVGCGGGGEKEPDGKQRSAVPRLSARLERALDAELRKRVRDTGVPGASAALVFADGREWHGAAGAAVLRPRRAMTSATALPLDGVTEVATAALALRLAERGASGSTTRSPAGIANGAAIARPRCATCSATPPDSAILPTRSGSTSWSSRASG